MFPYHDENETQRSPVVTILLIAACVLVWLFVQGGGTELAVAASVCNYGLIPGELTLSLRPGSGFPMGEGLACLMDPGRAPEHLLSSMFLHGSWMHLLGNMWFLWLFGNNIEDSMTRPRYLLFYLLCGLAAAMAQVLANPQSQVPMVGASGAISGVMGAYLVLFPRAQIVTLFPLVIYWAMAEIPALVLIPIWFALQFVNGWMSLATTQNVQEVAGVAWWAHIGGFVVGVAVGLWVRAGRGTKT